MFSLNVFSENVRTPPVFWHYRRYKINREDVILQKILHFLCHFPKVVTVDKNNFWTKIIFLALFFNVPWARGLNGPPGKISIQSIFSNIVVWPLVGKIVFCGTIFWGATGQGDSTVLQEKLAYNQFLQI